MHVLATS